MLNPSDPFQDVICLVCGQQGPVILHVHSFTKSEGVQSMTPTPVVSVGMTHEASGWQFEKWPDGTVIISTHVQPIVEPDVFGLQLQAVISAVDWRAIARSLGMVEATS